MTDLDDIEAKLDELKEMTERIDANQKDLVEQQNEVEAGYSMLADDKVERNKLVKEIKGMLKEAVKEVATDKKRLIEIAAKAVVYSK